MAGEKLLQVRARTKRPYRDPALSVFLRDNRSKDWHEARWKLGSCMACDGEWQPDDLWVVRLHPRANKWLCAKCFF